MTDKIKIFAAILLMFVVFAIGFILIGVMLGYGHGCPQCPEITADTVASIDSTVTGVRRRFAVGHCSGEVVTTASPPLTACETASPSDTVVREWTYDA